MVTVATVLLVLLSAGQVYPLDLKSVLTGYSISGWAERDGVLLGPVRALARSRDGFLWVGTDSGLLRFDGVRFREWTGDGIPAAGVTALHVDGEGALLVAFAGGAGVRVIRDGRLTDTIERGTVTGTIASFASDLSGRVWAGGSDGLFVREQRQWRRVGPAEGVPVTDILSLLTRSDGTLWIASASGLYRWGGMGSRGTAVRGGRVRGLAEDAAGHVWFGDFTTGVAQADGIGRSMASRQGRGNQLLYDSVGNLWVGTLGQGLWRLGAPEDGADGLEAATVELGLLNDGIWTLLEDEHGIWVGTNSGLNLLTPYRVTPVVNLGIVNSADVADAHSLWVGTARGLVRVAVADPPRILGRPLLADVEVRFVHRDAKGRVWLLTPQGFGRLANERFQALLTLAPVAPDRFTAITSDTQGRVWVAHRDVGILTVAGDRLLSIPVGAGGLQDITALHAASDGKLWVIARGGREVHVIDPSSGLADDSLGMPRLSAPSSINAVIETRDGDLWFATMTGVLRFRRGEWSSFGAAQGLPNQPVTALAEDSEGTLWLATTDGLLVTLQPAAAEAVVSGRESLLRYAMLDQSDGVAGVAVRRLGPRVARAPDGTLWFTTGRGMTVVNPRAVSTGTAALDSVLAIDTAIADDTPVAVAQNATLGPNVERLRIEYTALNVRWPGRLRFRYRLDGFDQQWTEAGTAREATYTNLRPGRYRFHVTAQSEKDSRIRLSRAWDFSVAPAFYQTRTFVTGIVAALGLALFCAWRLRLHQVRRSFAQVLAERARVSRELHDTLLQSLAGVALQIGDAAADVARSPDAVQQQLFRIRKQVEHYASEAARTIRNLRSPLLEQQGLAGALRDLVVRSAVQGGPSVTSSITGTVVRLPDDIEHQIFRIAQEAVTNSIRHSCASRIGLELHYEPDHVTMRIVDDGVGFDPGKFGEAHTHFGLQMMRERVQHVGGRLEIRATADAGTEVIASLPLRAKGFRAAS